MSQDKQAKILNEKQIVTLLRHVKTTRTPKRDLVMFLLSVKAGLRAKEIANLTWIMVEDAEGNIASTIELQNKASKGKGGRSIPINKELRQSLIDFKATPDRKRTDWIITTNRSSKMSDSAVSNWFLNLYRDVGFEGCSSHSGRRTFVTNGAKKIVEAGGSLRDIQQLVGHKSLQTTQSYIEGDTEAKRRVVDLI